jgi:hypothetical protein
MGSLMRIIILVAGIAFFILVMSLLAKRKINEKNTLVWLMGSIGIILISAFPELLDWLAALLGVSYPPSLLFLVSALVLLIMVLYQSMQISVLNEKVKQLSQHVSLRNDMQHEEGDSEHGKGT